MEEVSRREALKRGAAVGVGVLWATPAVQAVSMVRSAAAAASPPPEDPVYYAIKIEEGGKCEDIWDQIGRDTDPSRPKGKCLTPNAGPFAVVPGGCGKVAGSSTGNGEWAIELEAGCEIVGDNSLLLIKAGTDCVSASPSRDGQKWYFKNPASNGKDISHIEMVICCRPTTD